MPTNRTSASFWRLTNPLLPLGIAALAILMGTVAPAANADGRGAAAETAIPRLPTTGNRPRAQPARLRSTAWRSRAGQSDGSRRLRRGTAAPRADRRPRDDWTAPPLSRPSSSVHGRSFNSNGFPPRWSGGVNGSCAFRPNQMETTLLRRQGRARDSRDLTRRARTSRALSDGRFPRRCDEQGWYWLSSGNRSCSARSTVSGSSRKCSSTFGSTISTSLRGKAPGSSRTSPATSATRSGRTCWASFGICSVRWRKARRC